MIYKFPSQLNGIFPSSHLQRQTLSRCDHWRGAWGQKWYSVLQGALPRSRWLRSCSGTRPGLQPAFKTERDVPGSRKPCRLECKHLIPSPLRTQLALRGLLLQSHETNSQAHVLCLLSCFSLFCCLTLSYSLMIRHCWKQDTELREI